MRQLSREPVARQRHRGAAGRELRRTIDRELDPDRAAEMLAREFRDHRLVVVQIANVNIVARRDRQNVAVEYQSRALLHEARERGATGHG